MGTLHPLRTIHLRLSAFICGSMHYVFKPSLPALSIRDYVIVDRLDLELAAGFTALTGETGAGKSILLDALMLALGDRADPAVVRAGAQRAEVSADFDAAGAPAARLWLAAQDFDEGDGACLVRRTIDATGRS